MEARETLTHSTRETALSDSRGVCYAAQMQLTAVFVPAAEGGYTALVEEIPGAISEGETLEEARENLADALRMVLECNRDLAREHEPAETRREVMELAAL